MNRFLYYLFLFFFTLNSLWALEKVNVQLQWKYQFQFAGFIMAKELGYYEKAGFDVNLLEYTHAYDIEELLNGKADYLISNSSILLKDKELYHVTLLATYFQKSPLIFVTQKNINKIQELKGKRIMMNMNEIHNSILSILLTHYGINKSNATFIELSYNIDDFIEKKVDAMAVFRSNELYKLDKKKVEYNIIDPTEFGYTTSAINLFTSHKNLLQNPQKVEAFVEATNKGWEYALSHIEEVAKLIHKKYAPNTSVDSLIYEGNVTKELMLTNIYDIGEINEARVVSIYKQLLKLGKLDTQQEIDTKLLTLDGYKNEKHTYLTEDERIYINKKKIVRVCVDPKWKPLEWIDEKGIYRGMGADYLEVFKKSLGIETELFKTENWAETISAIKEKKCDILPMAGITPERREFLNFTEPYFKAPYVIATTQKQRFIEDIATKLDEKYAVVQNSAIIDDLKRLYPSIQIVPVRDISEGLSFVNAGKVFGFINITPAISYLIQQDNLVNIKIAGILPIGFKIAVASRKDEPELSEIFQKAIENMSVNTEESIKNRWVTLTVESKTDYTFLYQVLAFFIVLLLAFIYRQIVLNRVNASLQEKVKEKTGELLKLNSKLEEIVEERTAQLEYQAFYDSLTSLPNRVLFHDRLTQGIEKAKRNNENLALFFIDLDRFKQINDSLGHQVGDEVLKIVSYRLQNLIRKGDTLSRLGGDEFTIILDHLKDPNDAALLADKILKSLEEPIEIKQHKLYLSTSIGISIYPKDDVEASNLLKDADAAMYKAKDEGRNNFQFYSAEMTEMAFKKVMLQGSLRQAIDKEEFVVFYQPQVDAKREKIIGLEALVRWNHPNEGLISPFHFIAAAEETGLVVEIDQLVMKSAMKQVALWHEKGIFHGTLSLNLAAKQLANPDCITILQQRLEEYSFKASWLELEVTESDIMQRPEEAIKKLEKIHSLGIKVSIDDFGTGYSSLSYLKRFPIDKLKIDQSFVRDIPEDEDDSAIVKAVIALGNSLGLSLIAEGVETEEQKEFLLENSCVNIQGYLYAKPMCAEDTEKFICSFDV